MRYSTVIIPLWLLVIPQATNAADCQPVFVNSAQSLTIDGVEIEPGARALQDFQVRVRNAGGGELCAAVIRVARDDMSPNPDFPSYLLSAPGNRQIEVLPDLSSGGTTESDVVIANAPPGPQGRAIPFQIGVPTEWGLRAGSYVEQLQLSLVDDAGNVVDRATLTLTIVIPSAVSLRLVGAVVGGEGSGPAQVDLGNLSTSTETHADRFGARILSTAPYVVSLSSVNRGYLLHEHGREQVPYRLYFDGNLVDLAGSNEFPYFSHTPKAGDQHPISVVVPPVVAIAGRYSDRVTVTVTAI